MRLQHIPGKKIAVRGRRGVDDVPAQRVMERPPPRRPSRQGQDRPGSGRQVACGRARIAIMLAAAASGGVRALGGFSLRSASFKVLLFWELGAESCGLRAAG